MPREHHLHRGVLETLHITHLPSTPVCHPIHLSSRLFLWCVLISLASPTWKQSHQEANVTTSSGSCRRSLACNPLWSSQQHDGRYQGDLCGQSSQGECGGAVCWLHHRVRSASLPACSCSICSLSRDPSHVYAQNEAVFVSFVTAGFPAKQDTVEVLLGLEAGGADIIELGVPFSDPQADGPAIQRSNEVRAELQCCSYDAS